MLGAVVAVVQEHFDVTAAQLFTVTQTDAADFLEVYRGVIPPSEFHDSVVELASGPLVALEVAVKGGVGSPTCEAFRELCGPRWVGLAAAMLLSCHEMSDLSDTSFSVLSVQGPRDSAATSP